MQIKASADQQLTSGTQAILTVESPIEIDRYFAIVYRPGIPIAQGVVSKMWGKTDDTLCLEVPYDLGLCYQIIGYRQGDKVVGRYGIAIDLLLSRSITLILPQ